MCGIAVREVHLLRKLIKSWWLLALCAVLDAIISIIYLMRRDTDGTVTFHPWHATAVFLGKLTLAAGLCTIAAGLWNSRKGKSWLPVLNGLAGSAWGDLSFLERSSCLSYGCVV